MIDEENKTTENEDIDNENNNGNIEKETTEANAESADVSITKEKVTSPGLEDIADAANFLVRGIENGIINRSTGSSVVLRQSGQINLSASKYSQYKLNPSGKIMEESLESVTVTNRKKYSTDDIVVNEHKMNPYMYELTDMKELSNHYNNKMLVGNFTAFGTVLVKAWEPELKRYVLIRRLARMPMFSPVLNVPEINPGLDISDPLKVDHNILAKSTKGYQVNKPLHDKASLIGKAGVDRAGINRSGGATGTMSVTLSGNDNAEKIWNFLKAEGFTDEGAAGVIGNLMQESHCDPAVSENDANGGQFVPDGETGYGIVQWTSINRQQNLLAKAQAMGKPISSLEVQLAFMKDEAMDYGTWQRVQVCRSIDEATTIWHDEYEASNDYNAFGNIQHRIDFAVSAYNTFKGKK